jgi:hypothetical protein
MRQIRGGLTSLLAALLLQGCATFNEVATVLATPFVILGAALGLVEVPTPSSAPLRFEPNLSSPLCVDYNYALACRREPMVDQPQSVTLLMDPGDLPERLGSLMAATLVKLSSQARRPKVAILHSDTLDTEQLTSVGKLLRLLNENYNVETVTFGEDGIKEERAIEYGTRFSSLFVVQPTGAIKDVAFFRALQSFPNGLIFVGRDLSAAGDAQELFRALTGVVHLQEGESLNCDSQPVRHSVALANGTFDGIPEHELVFGLEGRLDAAELGSEALPGPSWVLSRIETEAPACASGPAPTQGLSLGFALPRDSLAR